MQDLKKMQNKYKCKKCGKQIECMLLINSVFIEYCEYCKEYAKNLMTLKKRLTEANFTPKHKEYINLKLYDCKLKYYKDVKLNDNIFIYGNTGRGKTLYACHRLFNQIKSGMTGRIYTAPRLINDFRSDAKRGGDIRLLDEIIALDCLVLDDIGVGRHNEYALEYYYMLIDEWYLNKKGGLTIVSNLDLGTISKQIDDRVSSRISEMCRIFLDKGKDFRLKGSI